MNVIAKNVKKRPYFFICLFIICPIYCIIGGIVTQASKSAFNAGSAFVALGTCVLLSRMTSKVLDD